MTTKPCEMVSARGGAVGVVFVFPAGAWWKFPCSALRELEAACFVWRVEVKGLRVYRVRSSSALSLPPDSVYPLCILCESSVHPLCILCVSSVYPAALTVFQDERTLVDESAGPKRRGAATAVGRPSIRHTKFVKLGSVALLDPQTLVRGARAASRAANAALSQLCRFVALTHTCCIAPLAWIR